MIRSVFRIVTACALGILAAFVIGYEWFMKVLVGPACVRRDALPLPVAKALHRAAAFVARMAKRERPRMEAGWRMCPSI